MLVLVVGELELALYFLFLSFRGGLLWGGCEGCGGEVFLRLP